VARAHLNALDLTVEPEGGLVFSFDPEQFGGVTAKADSWSFACAMLELATGRKPWEGEKMASIVRRVMAR